ncbi:MAG: copper resistance protein CopC [Nitrospirae bacterium]|nr:copper resistance protein CopC [Nitrospirota bacterium]MBI3594491.1 copper resistance protein CopC [Nitrospirota bacterium]
MISRSILYGGVLLGLLLLTRGSGSAHVFPDHSDPRVGSEINSAPPMVRIWFDGQIEPIFSTLQVLDASGKEVSLKNSRVDEKDPSILEVSIPSLSSGKYSAIWKVLARDGHLTEGKFSFTVK